MAFDTPTFLADTHRWLAATGQVLPFIFPDKDPEELRLCVRFELEQGGAFGIEKTGFDLAENESDDDTDMLEYVTEFSAHTSLQMRAIMAQNGYPSDQDPFDLLGAGTDAFVAGLASFVSGDTYDDNGDPIVGDEEAEDVEPTHHTAWSVAYFGLYFEFASDGALTRAYCAVDGLDGRPNHVVGTEDGVAAFLDAIAHLTVHHGMAPAAQRAAA